MGKRPLVLPQSCQSQRGSTVCSGHPVSEQEDGDGLKALRPSGWRQGGRVWPQQTRALLLLWSSRFTSLSFQSGCNSRDYHTLLYAPFLWLYQMRYKLCWQRHQRERLFLINTSAHFQMNLSLCCQWPVSDWLLSQCFFTICSFIWVWKHTQICKNPIKSRQCSAQTCCCWQDLISTTAAGL